MIIVRSTSSLSIPNSPGLCPALPVEADDVGVNCQVTRIAINVVEYTILIKQIQHECSYYSSGEMFIEMNCVEERVIIPRINDIIFVLK